MIITRCKKCGAPRGEYERSCPRCKQLAAMAPVRTRAQYDAGLKRIGATLEWMRSNGVMPDGGALPVMHHAPFESFTITKKAPAARTAGAVSPLDAVKKACETAARADCARVAAIRAAREAGHSLASIGRAAGITGERVRQLTITEG